MSENSTVRIGFGFLDALAILFIALKLLGYITWSWWWVLSPIWIPAAFALVIGIIVLTVVILKN